MLIGTSEAARRAGVAKSTITRAIARGRLSVTTSANGTRLIDTAELARWSGARPAPTRTRENPQERTSTRTLALECDRLRGEVDRLSRELEHEREERRELERTSRLERAESARERTHLHTMLDRLTIRLAPPANLTDWVPGLGWLLGGSRAPEIPPR